MIIDRWWSDKWFLSIGYDSDTETYFGCRLFGKFQVMLFCDFSLFFWIHGSRGSREIDLWPHKGGGGLTYYHDRQVGV